MNRKAVEEKARQLAAATFSDGTMRTVLYERTVGAFCPKPDYRCPQTKDDGHA